MDERTFSCAHCGMSVTIRVTPHNKKQRFCGDSCKGKAWRAAKAGPKQTRTFKCEGCGKSVTVVVDGRTNKKRFCGITCQVQVWIKENAERHEVVREQFNDRQRKSYAAWVDKPNCRFCDDPVPLGHQFICAKPDCKQLRRNEKLREMRAEYKRVHGRPYRAATHAKSLRKRKAIAKNAPWEDFEDREIYERDGWTCQIGLHSIDPEAKHPDLGCATIDHILPRSYGGGHTRDNVRTACLFHNMSRGNKVSDEDLELLGMCRADLGLVIPKPRAAKMSSSR